MTSQKVVPPMETVRLRRTPRNDYISWPSLYWQSRKMRRGSPEWRKTAFPDFGGDHQILIDNLFSECKDTKSDQLSAFSNQRKALKIFTEGWRLIAFLKGGRQKLFDIEQAGKGRWYKTTAAPQLWSERNPQETVRREPLGARRKKLNTHHLIPYTLHPTPYTLYGLSHWTLSGKAWGVRHRTGGQVGSRKPGNLPDLINILDPSEGKAGIAYWNPNFSPGSWGFYFSATESTEGTEKIEFETSRITTFGFQVKNFFQDTNYFSIFFLFNICI